MRLVAPVTRGYFFSLAASRLVDVASPQTISIDKKKISSGTQGLKIVSQISTFMLNTLTLK